jgi:hypothetical protein
MIYNNILVEREFKKLRIQNPVIVTLEFDKTIPPIGIAILTNKEDGVYADITVDHDLSGLYPAIGFEYKTLEKENGKIYELSFSQTRNQDEKIKPIK